jgi:PRC-barrel domain
MTFSQHFTVSRSCLMASIAIGLASIWSVAVPLPSGTPSAQLDTNSFEAFEEPTSDLGWERPGALVRHHELASVLGREVRTRVEGDVGRIIDVLVDRQGRARAAVIEFGGFLGIGVRKIAVEWPALRFESAGSQAPVIVDITRNEMRLAPEYKASELRVVRRMSD